MATVCERPMSALSDAPPMPRHRSQQRRPSVVDVEIIDVDQLDDVPSTSTLSRPAGQSREVIVIDSDDESAPQPQASGSTRAASRRRRLISPPPPVAEAVQEPPVPPLPHRFAVLASFPTNPRTLDAGTPPVIRPIERNFDLVANVRPLSTTAVPAHPNRHRRLPVAEPRAERHHIGLGGAIIAFNDQGPRLNNNRDRNRRDLRNHIANDEEQHGIIRRGFSALRRLYTTFARVSPADEDDVHDDDEFNFTFAPLNAAAAAAAEPGRFVFQNPLLLPRRRAEEDKYKPEYTHPDPPQAGYTFNFAPPEPGPSKPARVVIDLAGSDSEDGPVASTSKAPPKRASPPAAVRELLICARCLDPLVLGGGLVGDEGRRRKVWALRCGHMIDGQCLDVVGVPEQGAQGKGKGKAKANDADDSMRSRLRARSRAPVPPVPTFASDALASSPTAAGTTTVLGKRRRGARARVEATHEWPCPVEDCGRVHASVRIDGVWVPEPDKPRAGSRGRWKKAVPLPPPAGFGDGDGGVAPGRGAVAVFV